MVGQAQTIPGGPVATQEVIKELGTNGGGFYNANSAHPFENPNPLSNLFDDLPAAGHPGLPDPHLRPDGQGQAAGLRDPRRDGDVCGPCSLRRHVLRGPGRRLRRRRPPVPRWRARRPASASGPRRCWRSRRPVRRPARSTRRTTRSPRSAAALALFHMMLGEVTPGGTGSGLYGMLVLAVLAVFVAGLMVGRTPEYLKKKITAREMKLVSLYILTTPALVLVGAVARDGAGDGAGLDLQHRQPARVLRGAVRVHLGAVTTTAARSAVSARTSRSTTPLSGS